MATLGSVSLTVAFVVASYSMITGYAGARNGVIVSGAPWGRPSGWLLFGSWIRATDGLR